MHRHIQSERRKTDYFTKCTDTHHQKDTRQTTSPSAPTHTIRKMQDRLLHQVHRHTQSERCKTDYFTKCTDTHNQKDARQTTSPSAQTHTIRTHDRLLHQVHRHTPSERRGPDRNHWGHKHNSTVPGHSGERCQHLSDQVKSAESPSSNPALWSANVCYFARL